MKKLHILSTAVVLALLASTTPASALSLGAAVSGNASVSADHAATTTDTNNDATISNDNAANQNDTNANAHNSTNAALNASMARWKNWAFNSGIAGTVTATSNDAITVKGANGTIYTVNTADANVRYANGNSVATGDHVYVQGAVNGNSVVATLVVDAKTGTAKPTDEENRKAIVGTVTATSDNSLTILSKDGKTYTVSNTNASVWKAGNKKASASDVSVGDSVVVQGTVSGLSISAARIMAIKFPGTADDGIHGTVTAVNNDSITIQATGGATYTVNTNDATYANRKGDAETRGDIKTGDSVVVMGDLNGSTINATTISEANTHVGFFARIGSFFKHLFGKKADTDSNQ